MYEYLIGSFVTIAIVLLNRLFKNKKESRKIAVEIQESQTTIFEMIKNTEVVYEMLNPKLKTQATQHHESNVIRVIFAEQQAYWIKDSVFYTADIDGLGFVDVDSTRAVDTMTMDKIQLDKMSFIVEKLTEGK